MKIKKLMFGLAITPFLLASCNKALEFDGVKNWISNHYTHKEDDTHRAIGFVSWDFHATNGLKAENYAEDIFVELNKISFDEHVPGVIPSHVNEKEGHEIRIGKDYIQEIIPLNAGNFSTYSEEKPEENDIYKINNGCFSVTYKRKIECIPPDVDSEGKETYTYATCGCVYNTEGYCTDFGYKASKFIDKDNSLKLKILVHFIYENDPFE